MSDPEILVGQSFLVRYKQGIVVMVVTREELGWCYCTSRCLQYTTRLPSDSVRHEIKTQREMEEQS